MGGIDISILFTTPAINLTKGLKMKEAALSAKNVLLAFSLFNGNKNLIVTVFMVEIRRR